MTHYINNGNTVMVLSESAVDLGTSLPVKTYTVKHDPKTGFYLELTEDFKPLDKYYGDTVTVSDKIIRTFKSRECSTGALFVGEKGSGKSLLAKLISSKMMNEGYPTIIVNTAFVKSDKAPSIADDFARFIQMIDTKCVVLLDEFEKLYDKIDDQNSILTLLDGLFSSNKLFILTCNDKSKINRHLKNRPSRIYYMIDFMGLDEVFIRDYCIDKIQDFAKIEKIVSIAKLFKAFNFDMLQTMVEEINRYGEDPVELIKILNVKPENDTSGTSENYRIERIWNKDGDIDKGQMYSTSLWMNPISGQPFEIDFKDDSTLSELQFTIEDIVAYDASEGVYKFENDKGEGVILQSKREKSFSYSKFLM